MQIRNWSFGALMFRGLINISEIVKFLYQNLKYRVYSAYYAKEIFFKLF